MFWRKAVIALILCFALVRVDAAPLPPEIVSWAETNVYDLATPPIGGGSAFFIGVDTLLTACHVVEGKVNVFVFKYEKNNPTQRFWGQVTACDVENDIALIKLSTIPSDTQRTTIADKNPERGDVVFQAGYPLGMPLIIRDGHWQQQYDSQYLFTGYTMPGDSGSPLLILEDGEVKVVGLITSLLSGRPPGEPEILFSGIGFAKDHKVIERFLDENT